MNIHLLLLAAVTAGFASCRPPSTSDPAPPAPEAAAPDPSMPANYVGLEEKAAGEMADKAGLKWRVIEVDGESRPATMDHRPDRLNFAIKDGKVIRVTQG